MSLQIRKITTVVEEIRSDGSRDLATPVRLAAAVAVVTNPFAGEFVEDLSLLSNEYAVELGTQLTDAAARALGTEPTIFGKASYVGEAGEVQHGSAIIHSRGFADPIRRATSGTAPVPCTEKRAGIGGTFDVPLRKAKDRGDLPGTSPDHLFSWELRVTDAPRANEFLVAVVLGDGVRPDSRKG